MRNQDDPVDRYPFPAIDHVQLAMPTGEEDRAFYCSVCDPFGNRIELIGQGIVLAFR